MNKEYTNNPSKIIKNYDGLSIEDKIIAEEKIYKKQLKSKPVDRTLQEIIDNQIKAKQL